MTAAGSEATDDQLLAGYASRLAGAIELAAGPWVRRCVQQRCAEYGRSVDQDLDEAIERAASRCATQLGAEVRELLSEDIDEQHTTPLALVRSSVSHPTRVLRDAGVPPVDREEFDLNAFPDDDYDLTPATFADLDDVVAEAALVWGAAKAHVHLARRRAEGMR